MLRLGLAALLPLSFAGQAMALSCLPWGPTDAYLSADKAETRFSVVQGHLRFDEKLLPKVDWNHQEDTPAITSIPAHVTGKALNRTGFKAPFSQDLVLEVLCFGPWCAGAADGGDYLMFIEHRDDGLVLQVDPCGGYAFSVNSRKVQKQMRQCFNGGDCPPSDKGH
jgi:hypothetical protein